MYVVTDCPGFMFSTWACCVLWLQNHCDCTFNQTKGGLYWNTEKFCACLLMCLNNISVCIKQLLNVVHVFMAKTKAHAVNFVQRKPLKELPNTWFGSFWGCFCLLPRNLKTHTQTHWCGSKPQRNTLECVTSCLDPYWCALISLMEQNLLGLERVLNALKYHYYTNYSDHYVVILWVIQRSSQHGPKLKHTWQKKGSVTIETADLLTKNPGLKCFDSLTLTHTQAYIVFTLFYTYTQKLTGALSFCLPDLPPGVMTGHTNFRTTCQIFHQLVV